MGASQGKRAARAFGPDGLSLDYALLHVTKTREDKTRQDEADDKTREK
jgi:hypothetical protein